MFLFELSDSVELHLGLIFGEMIMFELSNPVELKWGQILANLWLKRWTCFEFELWEWCLVCDCYSLILHTYILDLGRTSVQWG